MAELPTWEYGWSVTIGPGVPESLFLPEATLRDETTPDATVPDSDGVDLRQ